MNTFLPYPDFTKSAACLDRHRLGKQRSEVLILLGGGWSSHPASRMWRQHLQALFLYGKAICDEWTSRGYKDTCLSKMRDALCELDLPWIEPIAMPPWIGGPIHASHRSNLLRKDFTFYSQFGWEEHPWMPYVWPC
jgi:hypothetical protein